MNKEISYPPNSSCRRGRVRSCVVRWLGVVVGFLLAASVFGVSPAVAQEQSAAGDQEVAGGGFEVFRGRSEGVGGSGVGGVSAGSVNPRIAPADGPFAVGTRWKQCFSGISPHASPPAGVTDYRRSFWDTASVSSVCSNVNAVHFFPFGTSSVFVDFNRRTAAGGQVSYDALIYTGFATASVATADQIRRFARNFACRSLRLDGLDVDFTFNEVEVIHRTAWPDPSDNFFIPNYPSSVRARGHGVILFQRVTDLAVPAGFSWSGFNTTSTARYLTVHAHNQPVEITSRSPNVISSFTSGVSLAGNCLPLAAGTSFDLCRADIAAPVAAYRYEHRQGAQNCQPTPTAGTPALAVSYTHGTTPAHGTLNLQYTVSGDQTSNPSLFAPGYWRISGSGYSTVFACLDPDHARSTQTGQDDVSVTATTGSPPTTTYRCADTGTDARVRRTINTLGATATLTYLGAQPQQPTYAPLTAGTLFRLCNDTVMGPVMAYRFDYQNETENCSFSEVEGVSELVVSYSRNIVSDRLSVVLEYQVGGDQSSNPGLFAPGYWRIASSGFSVVFACLDTDLARNTQSGQDDVSTGVSADRSLTSYRCVDQGLDARTRRTVSAFGTTATLTYLGGQPQQSVYAPLTANTTFGLCQATITAQVPAFRYEQRAQPAACDTAAAEGLSGLAVSYTHGATANNRAIALVYTVEGDQSSNAVSFAPGYWRIAGPNYSVVFACLDADLSRNTRTGQDDVSVTVSADSSSTTYRCVDTGVGTAVLRTFDAFGDTVTLSFLGAVSQDSVFAPAEVNLVGLEVTQGTQDWLGSVELVRNRKTAVRAFFTTSSVEPVEVTATLRASIIGTDGEVTPVAGSENPVNMRGFVTVNSGGIEGDCSPDLVLSATNCRADIDSSLNFVLPQGWTDLAAGKTLRLSLEFPDSIDETCLEQIAPANMCSATVSFVEVDQPTVVMFPVTVEIPDENSETPSLDDLDAQFRRLQSMVPFAEQNSTTPGNRHLRIFRAATEGELSTNDTNDINGFDPIVVEKTTARVDKPCNTPGEDLRTTNNKLKEFRNELDDPDDFIFLGILEGDAMSGALGCAKPDYGLGSWYIGGIDERTDERGAFFGRTRNTGAHEVGHALMQPHTGRCDGTIANDICDIKLLGICDEDFRPKDEMLAYPHFGNPISREHDTDLERPLLGPLDEGANREVWGLDIRYLEGRSSPHRWFSLVDQLIVSNPRFVYSIMSFCRFYQFRTQGQWMDKFHHERIIDRWAPSEAAAAEGSSAAVMSDVFFGEIRFSDGSETGAVVDRIYSRPRNPNAVVAGEYVLELRNSTGTVVRSLPLAASRYDDDSHSGSDASGTSSDSASFGFVLNNPPDYASFAIKKGTRELLVMERSANAPSVTISGISENQMFQSDDDVSFSWVGSDTDGDMLTYRVYYSTDGGRSYEPFALETTKTRVSVATDLLAGSDMARFAVSVSDGTRSAFAETPMFRVAQHAPQVRVVNPGSGAVFAGGQGFVLEASGYDEEDGSLGFGAFSWRSDLDGNLGAGRYIVLSASSLTPGSHTITVTGTDSSQMTATATITITIAAQNAVPTAVDDIVSAELDTTVSLDVLANDIDVEGDIDPRSLKIIRTPMLGEAEIIASPEGNTVTYTAHTSGHDSFRYEICDGIDRCDTATVTISSGLAGCTIIGTEGDDTLEGTPGDDVICGLGGNDTIDGKEGNDIILGGAGDDTLYGRLGDDIIRGGLGIDQILGHRGNDQLHGGLGDDEIYGGAGNDNLHGGPGADQLHGEADNDTIEGDEGPDTIGGGIGNDNLHGGPGVDIIRGNAGADTIHGERGVDMIIGTASEDTVIFQP